MNRYLFDGDLNSPRVNSSIIFKDSVLIKDSKALHTLPVFDNHLIELDVHKLEALLANKEGHTPTELATMVIKCIWRMRVWRSSAGDPAKSSGLGGLGNMLKRRR